ncbi:hypothetical protein HY494_03165 [Candidatus Woesearchaeota archaeon]|nr:hypothetical protein [Candidatus Woesearchaeota archaeon]
MGEFCEICNKLVPRGWDGDFTWTRGDEIIYFCSVECRESWEEKEDKWQEKECRAGR